ncbi:AAA family ATPase, partial [Cyanobium sp. PCC 7001]|uniref:AAA family ATPase n=1 Tax=Cyanobium sp. PCC 7001 TaxID=180281 RepID=UPI001CED7CB9
MAARFLQLLGKDPATTRIRGFFEKGDPRKDSDRGRKGTYSHELVEQWITEGRGVYVVINDGGDTKTSISGCRALFNEWDDQPRPWQLTAWRALDMPEPTAQIDTGRQSIHTYWRLLEPITKEQFSDLQKRLAARGRSDPSIHDPSRVMRLPGCPRGDGDREPVLLLEGTGTPHDADTFEALLPPLPERPAPAPAAPANGAGLPPLQIASDLPPRPPEALEHALQQVPPFEHKQGRRQELVALCFRMHVELGADEALAVMQRHSPAVRDLPSYFRTKPTAISPGSLWPFLRDAYGIDISRRDLKSTRPSSDGAERFEAIGDAAGAGGQQQAASSVQDRQGAAQGPQQQQGIGTPEEALERLAERAAQLLADRVQFSARLPLMRIAADDMGITMRDAELMGMLTSARRRRLHGDAALLEPGQALDGSDAPWAWDGLILRGCMNLLVALPKVGKTSLLLAMIAAWHRNEPAFLDRPLWGPCPPVLLIGPDQPGRDWRRMLIHVGLMADDGRIKAPLVGLAHSGQPLHLTPEGIDTIASYAQRHPGLLVIVDSLTTAATMPLGLKEESPEAAMPVQELMEQLEPHGATLVLIHHAGKGNAQGSGTTASRGTTAIPGFASQVLKLEPVNPNNPGDRRRMLTTSGREGEPLGLVVERTDCGWVLHGSAAELSQQQADDTLLEKLTANQSDFLELAMERREKGLDFVTSAEVVEHLGLVGNGARQQARSIGQALKNRGLVVELKQPRPGMGGAVSRYGLTDKAIQALSRARTRAGATKSGFSGFPGF